MFRLYERFLAQVKEEEILRYNAKHKDYVERTQGKAATVVNNKPASRKREHADRRITSNRTNGNPEDVPHTKNTVV